MGAGATSTGEKTWPFLVAGAGIGLALGILVGIATDVPLAPESRSRARRCCGLGRAQGAHLAEAEPGPSEPGSGNGSDTTVSGEGGI